MRQRRSEAHGRRRVCGDRGSSRQFKARAAFAQHTELGAALREPTREKHGGKEKTGAGTRAQNRKNAGHHHGYVHPVLAAVFYQSSGDALLPVVPDARVAPGRDQLARLLQLAAQPHHLRVLQQGLPERLQKNHQMSLLSKITVDCFTLRITLGLKSVVHLLN